MGAISSKRFAVGTKGEFAYTVPSGYVAVIKCVTVYNGGTTTANASIFLSSTYVWVRSLPANSSVVETNLHLVVNGAETVYLSVTATGQAGYMGGFLMRTSPAARLLPALPDYGPPPAIEPHVAT